MSQTDKFDTEEMRSRDSWECRTSTQDLQLLRAAADHIDAQAAEIERLREALEGMVSSFEPYAWGSNENRSDALANARAALSGEQT